MQDPAVEHGSLDWLNSLDDADAAAELRACCAAGSWVRGMVDARPFPAQSALTETSDRLVAGLDDRGLDDALAAHARIGEHRTGSSREDTWSRAEQAAALTADARLQRLLLEGNLAYERRFGRAFLIRAAGRSAQEMYAAQQSRLGNDEHTERTVVLQELAALVRLRLEGLVSR